MSFLETSSPEDTVREAAALFGVPERPVFPIDILPERVRGYVEATSTSLTVPVEMVAMPLLAVAGSLAGNRLRLCVREGWHEYPTLFVAVVAPPGSAKSPALSAAMRPLHDLQSEAWDHYQRELADNVASENGRKPRLRHYFTTDPTVEAVADMLLHTPGIAIERDELSGWIESMNMYKGGKGSDRQSYLSIWRADPIKTDRKMSGSTLVKAPVVSIVGGIQPDLVGMMLGRDKGRDGLVERFLPLVPAVKPAKWTEAAPTEAQYRDAVEVFRQIDRIQPPDGHDAITVNLSRGAKELFAAWFDENAGAIEKSTGLAAGFASKLPATVARFALSLHLLNAPGDPSYMVTQEEMADAIELGEFCRAQVPLFLRLLNVAATDQIVGVEARILRILRISPASSWVARSEIGDKLRNVKSPELTTALDSLANKGLIQFRVIPTGTNHRQEWRLTALPSGDDPNTLRGNSGNSVDSASPGEFTESSEFTELRDPVEPEQKPALPADCVAPRTCGRLTLCDRAKAGQPCTVPVLTIVSTAPTLCGDDRCQQRGSCANVPYGRPCKAVQR